MNYNLIFCMRLIKKFKNDMKKVFKIILSPLKLKFNSIHFDNNWINEKHDNFYW